MFNVLAHLVFAAGLFYGTPASSQPAPFCPEGWSCGRPDGHRADTRRVDGRRDFCLIHHGLTTRDGQWQMMTLLYSADTTTEVDIGFGVTLLESATPGKDYRQIPLRSIRLLSADRQLDTRTWQMQGVDTTRTHVRRIVSEEGKNEIGSAIAIASGAAYGVLAETTDGRHVRIESDEIPTTRQPVREFQACIEKRGTPAGK